MGNASCTGRGGRTRLSESDELTAATEIGSDPFQNIVRNSKRVVESVDKSLMMDCVEGGTLI